jgi:hypothetical protein
VKRYAGQKEVRFKVTDKQKEIYQEVSWYLYENNMIDKSNIQSFGRWCIDYVCRPAAIHSKTLKQQQQQKRIQQPYQLLYPTYYDGNQTQPF